MISSIRLDVADFLAVALTTTLADDAMLARHLFRGDDHWIGSSVTDLIRMGAGKDYDRDGDYGTFDTV